MKLKTDNGVSLHKIRMKSAKEIFRCIDNSRDFLREWLPFVDRTHSFKDTEKFIRALDDTHSPYGELVFEIRHEGNFAGLIGLKGIDKVNMKAEIGYWLDKEFVGKGIMIRSCKALIDHAFDSLALNRLTIRCAVDNVRSCNIPKQLGFTFEGIERQGEHLHGRGYDLKVYSLLKKEWKR